MLSWTGLAFGARRECRVEWTAMSGATGGLLTSTTRLGISEEMIRAMGCLTATAPQRWTAIDSSLF